MSLTKSTALFGALALLSKVQAHGHVTGVVADGQWYSGYIPSFVFQNPPPVVAGWTTKDALDNGFVSNYDSPDIICHKGATPGGAYIKVAAGSSVELQWTEWPESHHGPVMDFLASCGDDCTTVDKTKLLFNKIDEGGLIDGSTPPGKWASDDLIANNNSWSVTIPSNIAPGKYVLRHDTIALHAAFDLGGSQAYPQCFNLEITGSGSNTLTSGTPGTDLYNAEDPGIHISIYQKLTSYIIPGPPVIDGSSSGPKPAPSSTVTSSTTSVVAAPSDASSTTTAAAAATTTTTKASGIDITASVTAPTQVVSDTATGSTSSRGRPSRPATTAAPAPSEPSTSVAPAPEPEPETSAPAPPPPPPPASPDRPAGGNGGNPVPGSGQSTSPVSFTSTVTGRIGKPTKFTCYIED